MPDAAGKRRQREVRSPIRAPTTSSRNLFKLKMKRHVRR